MTPEQAVDVLLKAASMALLNKQDHIVCEQAAKVLKDFIAPKSPALPPKEVKPEELPAQ